MRKVLVGLLCCVVFAAGCASHEAKKSEEVAPSATPAASQAKQAPAVVETAPATPPPAPAAAAPKAEAPAPVTETPSQPVVAEKQAAPTATLQQELQKIYFDFDSAELSQQSRDALTKNADYLKNNPSAKIQIEGNCDERGSDEYNLALGERRAKAAKDYLVTLGIPADRLSTISYGEERPAVQGHDEEAWAKNRRDEFVVK